MLLSSSFPTPTIPTFAIRYEEKDLTALSRVTLAIDPALSPMEVALRYREARKRYIPSKHRSMSDKHTALVLFMNSRPAAETYAQSMAAWNREHQNWKYSRETNFGRDVQAARRRLLGSEPQARSRPTGVQGAKERST